MQAETIMKDAAGKQGGRRIMSSLEKNKVLLKFMQMNE